MSAARSAQLALYAMRLLPPEEAAALERELRTSAEAREELAGIEETLAGIAAAGPEETPSPGLRERLLASLDPASPYEGLVARFARLFELGASRAREVLAAIERVAGDDWEAFPVPGVRVFHFDGGPGVAAADCGLVHLEPGTTFPRHRHLGDETNLVLAGAAEEDSGRLLLPGDLVPRPAGSRHAFRAVGDEPFVFAVVLHEGIEFEER